MLSTRKLIQSTITLIERPDTNTVTPCYSLPAMIVYWWFLEYVLGANILAPYVWWFSKPIKCSCKLQKMERHFKPEFESWFYRSITVKKVWQKLCPLSIGGINMYWFNIDLSCCYYIFFIEVGEHRWTRSVNCVKNKKTIIFIIEIMMKHCILILSESMNHISSIF